MKKIIAGLLLVTLAGLNSCTKMLDADPDGRIDYKTVFGDRYRIGGYLNTCYGHIPQFGIVYDSKSQLAVFSDEAHDSDDILNNGISKWYAGGSNSSSFPLPHWWTAFFTGIRKCNVFLENIAEVPPSVLDRQTKEDWTGQAYVLRAFYQLQLIKRYGGVPLMNKTYPTNYRFNGMKRNSFNEIVTQILSDCEAALAMPGFGWTSSSDADRGKMTAAVAHAIRSEAILYAVSPLWDDGTYTWQDAARITKEALDECLAHGYELYTTQPDAASGYSPYDVYFFTRWDVNRVADKETIYEIKNMQMDWAYCCLPFVAKGAKAGPCPTQEMVDCYETAQGEMPVLGYRDAEHLQPIFNPDAQYDDQDPYANRDIRLRASVFYNGTYRDLKKKEPLVETWEGGNSEVSTTDRRYTRTGYYLRKYTRYTSGPGKNQDGFFKLYRLAELYLNFAEAANEAYGPYTPVPAGSGKELSAADAVRIVRARVGMPPFPAGMSRDEFRIKYRNERRVELAFEEHRFFDVRRWSKPGDDLSATDRYLTGMKAIKKEDGTFEYQRFVINNKPRETYLSKYLLFPIQNSEVVKMDGSVREQWQNPGW